MEQAELEQIIEKARFDRMLTLSGSWIFSLPESIGNLTKLTRLHSSDNQLNRLPDSIGQLTELTYLNLSNNQLTSLPESIGNLANLVELNLNRNQLNILPETITNLVNLKYLNLSDNQLTRLPESIDTLASEIELALTCNQIVKLPENIGNLAKLIRLDLSSNQLSVLPEAIGNLFNLKDLRLTGNQFTKLPDSLVNLTNLTELYLENNPLNDLSVLQHLPNLKMVYFLDVFLPCRYFTKFSDWKPEWLLDEDNAEIRRILIEQVGYETICKELNAINLDNWREYTLLKIDGIEAVYDEDEEDPVDREPMLLLKMTCPSTQHIHILRVPPEMTSAEAAITWVNHGIHPDKFAVQT